MERVRKIRQKCIFSGKSFGHKYLRQKQRDAQRALDFQFDNRQLAMHLLLTLFTSGK